MGNKDTIIWEDIDNLLLDPGNPRLPNNLDRKDEKAILSWMLTNVSILELMASIASNGYFEGEPVLAVKGEGEYLGKYIIVEGNRRLSASKILRNPQLVDSKQQSILDIVTATDAKIPEKLPIIVFDDRDKIMDYLGYRHITGVKAWGPLAKARYLDHLYKSKKRKFENDNDLYKELAKIIGSKGYYVKRLHTAFRAYLKVEENNFFSINGLDENTIEFSNFNDGLTKFQYIGKFVGVNFENTDPIERMNVKSLEEVCKWMFERSSESITRLGEVRNLPKLNAILNPEYPEALKAFRDGKPINEAVLLTDEPNLVFSKLIKDAYNRLQIVQDYLYTISIPSEIDMESVKRINNLAADLYEAMKKRLGSPIRKID